MKPAPALTPQGRVEANLKEVFDLYARHSTAVYLKPSAKHACTAEDITTWLAQPQPPATLLLPRDDPTKPPRVARNVSVIHAETILRDSVLAARATVHMTPADPAVSLGVVVAQLRARGIFTSSIVTSRVHDVRRALRAALDSGASASVDEVPMIPPHMLGTLPTHRRRHLIVDGAHDFGSIDHAYWVAVATAAGSVDLVAHDVVSLASPGWCMSHVTAGGRGESQTARMDRVCTDLMRRMDLAVKHRVSPASWGETMCARDRMQYVHLTTRLGHVTWRKQFGSSTTFPACTPLYGVPPAGAPAPALLVIEETEACRWTKAEWLCALTVHVPRAGAGVWLVCYRPGEKEVTLNTAEDFVRAVRFMFDAQPRTGERQLAIYPASQ